MVMAFKHFITMLAHLIPISTRISSTFVGQGCLSGELTPPTGEEGRRLSEERNKLTTKKYPFS